MCYLLPNRCVYPSRKKAATINQAKLPFVGQNLLTVTGFTVLIFPGTVPVKQQMLWCSVRPVCSSAECLLVLAEFRGGMSEIDGWERKAE